MVCVAEAKAPTSFLRQSMGVLNKHSAACAESIPADFIVNGQVDTGCAPRISLAGGGHILLTQAGEREAAGLTPLPTPPAPTPPMATLSPPSPTTSLTTTPSADSSVTLMFGVLLMVLGGMFALGVLVSVVQGVLADRNAGPDGPAEGPAVELATKVDEDSKKDTQPPGGTSGQQGEAEASSDKVTGRQLPSKRALLGGAIIASSEVGTTSTRVSASLLSGNTVNHAALMRARRTAPKRAMAAADSSSAAWCDASGPAPDQVGPVHQPIKKSAAAVVLDDGECETTSILSGDGDKEEFGVSAGTEVGTTSTRSPRISEASTRKVERRQRLEKEVERKRADEHYF